jgi:acetylornithine deacetylase/succinyl-diaminopimelate desuccinylase family protein
MSPSPSDVRAAVADRRDAIVAFARELVAYRSENPKLLDDAGAQEAGRAQEAACQDAIEAALGERGMEVDRWEVLPGRSDVVGTLPGEGDGRSLILNGHVDVVPAGDPSDWPHDPWGAALVDGCIWGRGACDMKAGLASGIAAIDVLRDLGVRLAGDVVFESVVDEETGGPGTRATLERGHRADAAIVLEPTAGALMPVEGGLEWVRVTIRGRGGHSALRYRSVHAGGRGEAVSAIEKAAKLLAAVQELERHWGNRKVHPLMPKGITTINPGVIAGGSGGGEDGLPRTMQAYSNMADYCALGLSMKYLPDEDGATVRREFEEHVERVCAADPWLREHPPQIEWGIAGVSFPPAETPLDHPFAQTIGGAFEALHGAPRWTGFEAVTDLAWLAAAGIPGVIYGPGDARHAHGSNEHVRVDDILAATEVIALTIAEWCGTA